MDSSSSASISHKYFQHTFIIRYFCFLILGYKQSRAEEAIEKNKVKKELAFSLSSHALPSLPSSISELTHLEKLDLSYNKLSTLPDTLTALTNLKMLSLATNRFTTISASVLALANSLQWLNLVNNELATVPSGLSELTNLTFLSMHGEWKLPETSKTQELLRWRTLGGASPLLPTTV